MDSTAPAILRRDVFAVWKEEPYARRRKERVLQYVIDTLSQSDIDQNIVHLIRQKTNLFCIKIGIKWAASYRALNPFLKKEKMWLDETIDFGDIIGSHIDKPSTSGTVTEPHASVGRPTKNFGQCSTKSRKRKIQPILDMATHKEICFAAETSLRAQGKRDAAALIKQATQYSPKRANKIKQSYRLSQKGVVQYTPEEALALYVDAKMTKHQYKTIYAQAKSRNAKIYPSYNKVAQAKKDCYPSAESIVITETTAEIKLQKLLDHTASRLIDAQPKIVRHIDADTMLTLIYKWGCDGSSGHSTYKQKFSEEENMYQQDNNLFVISMVPLRLSNGTDIVWQNPQPSSTRYCRPIKLTFAKESVELITAETTNMENQINILTPTIVKIEDREIKIKHQLFMTMVDTKICNDLTGTSSQTCYICGATPKKMNFVTSEEAAENADITTYKFGLSVLHTWIRSYECLLHIGYKIVLQKWQARGEDAKDIVNRRKREIQEQFRLRMGLIVDRPKQGSGNTNDGNTARRFFANPSVSANITGVNETLITRFGVLLSTISSGYEIKIDAFSAYAKETAALYVQLYPWYYMPVSVHKLLFHAPEIINSALLPIGQLSEEALEARHKECRKFRENNARKSSRENNITDLIHMLLITSDPYIAHFRTKYPTKKKTLTSTMKHLLEDPPQECSSSSTEDESCNSSGSE